MAVIDDYIAYFKVIEKNDIGKLKKIRQTIEGDISRINNGGYRLFSDEEKEEHLVGLQLTLEQLDNKLIELYKEHE